MSEASGATIRLYRPGDERGLAGLLQATFPEWPKVETTVCASDHMLWKLSSDPESMRFQVVAEANGQIVGCRLFWLTWFRVHGERLSCRQGFDLAIHPDCQGQGILNEMWSYARTRFDGENDFNFGVGAHPAALHMRVAQGNIVIKNKLQVLVRAHDESPVASPAGDVHVRRIDGFDEAVGPLFAEASAQFDFIRERTPAYLNWRFSDTRSGMFTIYQAREGAKVLGYVVLSTSMGAGVIADLLVLPNRSDALNALVRSGLAYFADQRVATIECWIPAAHPYRAALFEHGFAYKKRGIHLSYRHLRVPASRLAFLTDRKAPLHIMAGDTDLV